MKKISLTINRIVKRIESSVVLLSLILFSSCAPDVSDDAIPYVQFSDIIINLNQLGAVNVHAFLPVILVMSVIGAEEIVSLKIISFLLFISIIFNDWISGAEITPLLKRTSR